MLLNEFLSQKLYRSTDLKSYYAANMEATEGSGRTVPKTKVVEDPRKRLGQVMALNNYENIFSLQGEPPQNVLELCARLHSRHGRTLVAVLHDLNQAARYASHLVALRKGGVVAATGPPGEVLTEELVTDVYGLACRVLPDPETGTPMVVPRRPDWMAERAVEGAGDGRSVAGG